MQLVEDLVPAFANAAAVRRDLCASGLLWRDGQTVHAAIVAGLLLAQGAMMPMLVNHGVGIGRSASALGSTRWRTVARTARPHSGH